MDLLFAIQEAPLKGHKLVIGFQAVHQVMGATHAQTASALKVVQRYSTSRMSNSLILLQSAIASKCDLFCRPPLNPSAL